MADKNKKTDEKKKPQNSETNNSSLAERTSLIEWIVAAVGLILVLFSIGYLTYEAITARDSPPNLLVKVISIKHLSNGYLVEFKVKNEGENPAANVVIEGKLSSGEKDIETKTTTINYVASMSERDGGLFYTEDPEQNKLEIKAIGYENP
jgi:uncharacterized protein (TIGR02588 family)